MFTCIRLLLLFKRLFRYSLVVRTRDCHPQRPDSVVHWRNVRRQVKQRTDRIRTHYAMQNKRVVHWRGNSARNLLQFKRLFPVIIAPRTHNSM